MATESDVQRYYDHGTRLFVWLGTGGKRKSIHRSLHLPGLQTAEECAAAVDRLVESQLLGKDLTLNEETHLLDLGCGAGGSAVDFARRHRRLRITGLTLSSIQAQLATRYAEAGEVASRCRFLVRSYLDLEGLDIAAGAYAIEAFLHTEDPDRFFSEAAKHIRSGGRLVICDDFLGVAASSAQAGSQADNAPSPHDAPRFPGKADSLDRTDILARTDMLPQDRREPTLARFIRGWRVGTLETPSEIAKRAERAGFLLDENRDLTAYIPLRRPRDRMIRIGLALAQYSPLLYRSDYLSSLMGGDALQIALANRWVEYRLLTFRRI